MVKRPLGVCSRLRSAAAAHRPSHFSLRLCLPCLQGFAPGGSSLFPSGLALPEPTPLAPAVTAEAPKIGDERDTFLPSAPVLSVSSLSFSWVPLYPPLPSECHSSPLSDSIRPRPFTGCPGLSRHWIGWFQLRPLTLRDTATHFE